MGRLLEQSRNQEFIRLIPQNGGEHFGMDILWLEVIDQYFSQEFEETIRRILLDMKPVTHLDCSALRQIVCYSDRLQKQGIRLELTNVNEHINRILKITRLIDKVHIV